jgi:serine/threonine protein kinase
VGPYEIQSAIGSGGMGEVYRAKDIRLGRDVAVKVLSKEFLQSSLFTMSVLAAPMHTLQWNILMAKI